MGKRRANLEPVSTYWWFCNLGILWVDHFGANMCRFQSDPILWVDGTHNLSKELFCFASRFPCQWPSVVSLRQPLWRLGHCKTTPGGRPTGESRSPNLEIIHVRRYKTKWCCIENVHFLKGCACDKTFDQPLAPTSFTSEHVGSSSLQVVSSCFNGYKTELQSQSTRKLLNSQRVFLSIPNSQSKLFHHFKQ